MSLCSIAGCDDVVKARGWCLGHYSRWRRHGDPTAGRPSPGSLAAFLESVLDGSAQRAANGCILWPYATRDGYAKMHFGGLNRFVGHLVLEHFAGPRPTPKHTQGHADHATCGNRSCVAPEHLSWQTPAEQTAQRSREASFAGESNPAVKFDDIQVAAALRRLKLGESQQQIADDIGCSQATVSYWLRRRMAAS